MRRLSTLVDIRRGERAAVGVAFVTLMAVVAGHSLLETARDTLFLTKISPTGLPLAYFAIAVMIVLVGQGVGLLRSWVRRARLLPAALVASSVVTAGFWFAIDGASNAVLYALYVWSGVVGTFIVGLFWIRVGDLFDVGQAKRIFPLIGIGGVVGATTGSFLARVFLSTMVADGLIVAAALVYLIAAIWVAFMWTMNEPDGVDSAYEKRSADMSRLEILRREPYLRRLSMLIAMSMVTVTVVDYLFKSSVARAVPTAELGEFFATYYTAINAISAVVQVFVAPALLSYLGVNRALVLFPLLLIASGFGLVFSAGHISAALILKGVDGSLRHSLYRTGMEILYLPLSADIRSRFKALLDGFAQRGGQAVASLAILACTTIGFGRWELEVGVLAFASIWLVLGLRMRRGYLALFRERLSLGRIDPRSDIPDLDLGALEQLLRALNSPDDAAVISALEMFAVYRKTSIVPALILYHPSPAVVSKAAEVLAGSERRDVSGVAGRLVDHPEPRIRAAALRLIVGEPATFARYGLRIVGRDDPVTEGMVAIGRLNAGQTDEHAARQTLTEVFQRSGGDALCGLAQAMRGNDTSVARWALIEMANLQDGPLCREVAISMAESPDQAFLPSLVGMLGFRNARREARRALVAIGEQAMEYLERVATEGAVSDRVLRHIPRSISRFQGQGAVDALVRLYRRSEVGIVRFKILRGLGRLATDDPGLVVDSTLIESELESCLRRAILMLDCRASAAVLRERRPQFANPAMDLVIEALVGKEANAMERFFRFMSLKYPKEGIQQIYTGLMSPDSRVRAGSRELLENVLDGPYRFAVRSLVDDAPDRDRLAGAAAFFDPSAGFNPVDVEAAFMLRLRGLLGSTSETIRLVAEHLVDELGLDPSQANEFSPVELHEAESV